MIEDIFVIITITYVISLTLGTLMEKYLKIPWIFSALFLGVFLSTIGVYTQTIQSESFQVLATLGMLVILFLIGFNIELGEMKKLKKQVISGTITIITFEGLCVSLLLYLGFPSLVNHSLLIAAITALSFATVGEAVLLPILKEFNVINTTFGQLTLGIGTLDDIIEVIVLVAVGVFLASGYANQATQGLPSPFSVVIALLGLITASLFLIRFKEKIMVFLSSLFKDYQFQYLMIFTVFFLFIAIGGGVYEGLAPVAAILSGLVSRQLFPERTTKDYSSIIDFIGYMFLAPLFFLSVGSQVSLATVLVSPFLIVAIWVVAKGAKLLASFALFRKLLGTKFSLLMGLGLSVRFSTSLIVQYILYKNGLISLTLYSALIGTAILMKPVIIFIYSLGLSSEKPP
jgi:CPA2 family monovalent cation:H+ antiporter-2